MTLKLAVSADGYIGRAGAGQVSISCPLSRGYAHGLRATKRRHPRRHRDGSLRRPVLTCRLPGCEKRSPIRVIVDARARTPLDSKVVRGADAVPTWIFVAPDAPTAPVAALRERGVSVLVAERDRAGRLDLADVLFQLGRAGITTLLVEGGSHDRPQPRRGRSRRRRRDRPAPIALGDGGVPALAGLPLARITDHPTFTPFGRRALGADSLQRLARKETP